MFAVIGIYRRLYHCMSLFQRGCLDGSDNETENEMPWFFFLRYRFLNERCACVDT